MNIIQFLQQIHESEYLFVDIEDGVETGTIYAWNGSNTVNIWAVERAGAGQFSWFENTDVFTIDFEPVTLDEVKQAIDRRIREGASA